MNSENTIYMLKQDRHYYIMKLREAILLLKEHTELSTFEICQALDIEIKEYEYIVDGL